MSKFHTDTKHVLILLSKVRKINAKEDWLFSMLKWFGIFCFTSVDLPSTKSE
jgi:hypothetical protein